MKNIYEILKEFELEVPEDKKAAFDKAWKENYRTKAEYEKATSQRDSYKESLDTVNDKLKKFDGVDVEEMKSQIKTLEDDLKKKDDAYAAKEADRAFKETLKDAIKTAGGRNDKAVMALLDIDALKNSKDQSADIKKALDAAKESDAYLFGKEEPINNPVGPTGGNNGSEGMGALASIRAAMGLPEKKGE